MLSKCYEIWNISNKGFTNYFFIKIEALTLLSSEIHRKNRTSDFKNISDYDYVKSTNSNF